MQRPALKATASRLNPLLAHGIDHRLPFVPEEITHLPFTSVYGELTPEQRLRYNQLFGLYLNELTAAFETFLLRYFEAMQRSSKFSSDLLIRIQELVADEEMHRQFFANLNQAAEPYLYAKGPFYFLKIPVALRLFSKLTEGLDLFLPMALLLAFMQEERSLFYGKLFERAASELEPRFASAQAAHLADETPHVTLNFELLELVWSRSSPNIRRLNAAVFTFAAKEFFTTPKRAGVRIVRHLVSEFKDLRSILPKLESETLALGRNREFLCSLYNRKSVPLSFQFMDLYPELHAVTSCMPAFIPGARHE